ncbi:MAG: hypothetical protein IJC94_09485 [Oscillospiraceae bacterium]|nr:hypothetical protein [Oscillospiraceae bacterium]MBQ9938150.1 hypothetical protein [Oscillospiraceae bacterium]
MGLFDNLKKQVGSAVNESADIIKNAVKGASGKSETFTFTAIPASLAEFTAIPQAAMSTPFETAAMTVIALCVYPYNADLSTQMLNVLKGPRPLSGTEISFLKDRFRGNDYVPRSYFNGATPQNDYNPSEPYTITVSENPYSYQNEGYAKLFIRSGGADSAREVLMRQAKDGKWYLWEQFLMVGIRQPESENPWA